MRCRPQTLCDQFGVSRITVRRALADLADADLIERRQGVGSFVRDQPASHRNAGGGSFMDELRQTEFETEVDVIELDVRSVPKAIADQLGRGARCTSCGCAANAALQNR